MPQIPPGRRIPVVALAVASACAAWFIAQGARPVRAFTATNKWLTTGPVTVIASVLAPSAQSSVTLTHTVYTGQMALYGPKPSKVELVTVTLDWRESGSFLVTDGTRFPLLDPIIEGAELHFGLQDLVGRKGRWDVRLRIGTGSLAGPVTAPNDPLLGGYLLVSQSATRKLIPPPPVPPR